jgi:mannose-6-phosphate isomerase-like protein (cupin superfamily)
VDLQYFFGGAREKPVLAVMRKQERLRFPERAGRGPSGYQFESLDFHATERKLDAYYAEFQAVEPSALRTHAHPGAEFLYVLSGTLSVHVGGEEHVLHAGDSMYFDSSVPHGYRKSGGRTCAALVVTTP